MAVTPSGSDPEGAAAVTDAVGRGGSVGSEFFSPLPEKGLKTSRSIKPMTAAAAAAAITIGMSLRCFLLRSILFINTKGRERTRPGFCLSVPLEFVGLFLSAKDAKTARGQSLHLELARHDFNGRDPLDAGLQHIDEEL